MPPRPIYQPQSCRLCKRLTIYLTRSGLSGHATLHHGCWYSAKLDSYIQIPEADLEAKWALLKQGQAHQKCRKDPADNTDWTAGQDRPLARAQHFSSLRQRSGIAWCTARISIRPSDEPALSPPRNRRPHSPLMRRVESNPEDPHRFRVVVRAPTRVKELTASDAERATPLIGEGQDLAPPAKSRRPEGFPEAGLSIAPYQPPPWKMIASRVGWMIWAWPTKL